MMGTFIHSFTDELMKLAAADVLPAPEEPNDPRDAGSQARGIKAGLLTPPRVGAGAYGVIGDSEEDADKGGAIKEQL